MSESQKSTLDIKDVPHGFHSNQSGDLIKSFLM